MKIRQWLWRFGLLFLILTVSSCAPAAVQEETAPNAESEAVAEAVAEEAAEAAGEEATAYEQEAEAEEPSGAEEAAPQDAAPTYPPQNTPFPSPAPTQTIPTPTPVVETRIIELEWPDRIHLGDSDVIRLAIIPSESGYTLTTEFPDHQTLSQDVPVVRPSGYDLFVVARLEGVKFDIAPSGEQAYHLPEGEPVTWHWSLTPKQPGNHRLTITLSIRWVPLDQNQSGIREAVAYSKGLDVSVPSVLGLTRGQAMTTGLFGAIIGSVFSYFGLLRKPKKQQIHLDIGEPNTDTRLELPTGLNLAAAEKQLLQTLFSRYHRLSLLQEFRSGYSGARTFLLLPHLADGRTDAHTIAKIGQKSVIQQEFANFQTYVKHTLPPITARIQHPPVSIHGSDKAALQYTFIGEKGSMPTSLRQALLHNPDPPYLQKLFETFAPNWWSQRNAYTFRLEQEYDILLPPHYEVEPASGKPDVVLGGRITWPGPTPVGTLISLRNFDHQEPRAGYISLSGHSTSGQPPLRVRWRGEPFSHSATGRITATRSTLFSGYSRGLDRFGLPNPFALLSNLLNETITASRSIIHGDLNLENILVGPGDFIWLIDFAETRHGHPLTDFAHLETEIISHIIAPQVENPQEYLDVLDGVFLNEQTTSQSTFQILLTQMHGIASRCMVDPAQPREYYLALFMSCLGALKYRNLNQHQKHLLYLSAAYIAQSL